MIQVGDEAPDFLARSTENKGIWLRGLRGRPVVLDFFPKGFTPGCAAEADGLCDHDAEIQRLGAELIGVSVDDIDKQSRLAARSAASFSVIGDESKQISSSYGLLRSTARADRRVMVVIDETGAVEAVFEQEGSPAKPAAGVIEHLRGRAPIDHISMPPRTTREPGTIIAGRYQLKRLIDQGGIGEVWCAEHLHLRQDVAIKLLQESIRTSPEQAVDLLERFRLESQVAALLGRKTTHVVSVMDAGFSEVGPFLAMELVHGGTLLDELKVNGPMDPEKLLGLLEQIAGALDAAHVAGIVHRDLKPSNVLLEQSPGAASFVKLADFGLAKSTVRTLTLDRPEDTAESVVMGTVEYMSPEQLRGGEGADPRMDVWALGVLIYQMLTGMLPWNGPSKTSIVAKIVAKPFPLASSVRPGLPRKMDAFFSRALAKSPAERYLSVRALLDGYTRAIRGESVPRLTKEELASTMRVPAADLLLESRTAQEASTSGNVPASVMPPEERSRRSALAVVAALALGAAGIWLSLHGASVKGEEAASRLVPVPLSVGAPSISTLARGTLDLSPSAREEAPPIAAPPASALLPLTPPSASTSAASAAASASAAAAASAALASPPQGAPQMKEADPSSVF